MLRTDFLSSCAAAGVAGSLPAIAGPFTIIDADLRARVVRGDFSGVVAVAERGHVRFARPYGTADRAFAVPNRLATRFNIGSLGKLFTTAVITRFARDGTLRYGDTIGAHLPAYPNADAAANVTIRHLLDMTSGIGDIFGPRYMTVNHGDLDNVDAYLKLFADEPLAFRPGTQERYSNGGFIVLGAIIEAIAKAPFYDVVERMVFRPTGMRSAAYLRVDDVASDVATGYDRADDGSWTTNALTLPARGSPAGGAFAAISDLLAFVAGIRSGVVTLDFVDHPQTARFSLGGGAPGVNAMLLTNVADRYDLVVLANASPPSAQVVAHAIANALGDRPPT